MLYDHEFNDPHWVQKEIIYIFYMNKKQSTSIKW